MRKLLLAAVAALALGGSAFAMDYYNETDKGRIVGLLGAASQKCDARYDPVGMLNLADLVLASLRREGRFSEEEIMNQIYSGMGTFEGTKGSLGLKFACDAMGPTFAKARVVFNYHH
jgi:hypothetical protein